MGTRDGNKGIKRAGLCCLVILHSRHALFLISAVYHVLLNSISNFFPG